MKTNHALRFAILAALSSGSAMAQVVFDGTLPGTTAGSLQAVAGTYSINQGRGFVNGRNLFHSFQFFSVDAGETAVFQSTNAIRNIISRVTGNMPTTIDGTLSASNPNITSFWLINPAGIMVGESAVLDIPGAVALGAADTIQFSNGESWSALNDGFSDAATLSVNPMDFGFLGSTPGSLTIRGQNFASTGADTITDRFGEQRSWLLSGGPGVTIESATDLLLSEVKIETTTSDFAEVPATGNISIASDGNLTIGGSYIASTYNGFGNPVSDTVGSIDISGSRVMLNQSQIVSRTSSFIIPSGDISIVGSNITLNGSTIETNPGLGGGGSIRVESPTITLNGSFVHINDADGGAGDILIGSGLSGGNELDGSSITVNETSFSNNLYGPGGFISGVSSGKILLQAFSVSLNGGIFETSALDGGSTGSILVGSGVSNGSETQIGSSITLDGTKFQTSSGGFNGSIVFRAFSIALDGGAFESINTGSKSGGNIFLGSGLEELNGSSITVDRTTFQSSNRVSGSLTGGTGGLIELNAHHIALNGGSFESNGQGFLGRGGGVFVGAIANRDGSSITMDGTTFGSRGIGSPGGDITLQARSIALKGCTLDAGAKADGGSIVIDDDGNLSTAVADSSLTMVDSRVTVGVSGCDGCESGGLIHLGAGSIRLSNSTVMSEPPAEVSTSFPFLLGDIFVITHPSGELQLENSRIVSRAENTNGGGIFIGGRRRLSVAPAMAVDRAGGRITLVDSTIEASAGADGQGGDIAIFAGQTILQRSGILAQAEDGDGGSIEIKLSPGEVFVQDSASLVSADSGSGINGEVTIDSPNTDLNSALQPQDVDISRPATLASDVCTRTTTDSRSTFVRAGRGGVSERPDSYLTSTTADASENAKRGDIMAASLGSACL